MIRDFSTPINQEINYFVILLISLALEVLALSQNDVKTKLLPLIWALIWLAQISQLEHEMYSKTSWTNG